MIRCDARNSCDCNIKTWKQFAQKVRKDSPDMLLKLGEFNDCVLVTGCQRSGTTALARVITSSNGMVNYWFGKDDELDAALILSGTVDHKPKGRYCFQTTYLNEQYVDYYKHKNDQFKIIWVIRNPFSVVYSMIHNWGRFAFNELFDSCGYHLLSDIEKRKYQKFGRLSISRLHQACLSYTGKCMQLFEIKISLKNENIIIVDYDHLIEKKDIVLPAIYRFLDLPYNESYGDMLHSKSLDKAKRFSVKEADMVEKHCGPIYSQIKSLISL